MFDELKKSLLSLVGGKSQTMRRYLGEATDDWDESKHPRGNPGNAGQFAKKGQQTQGNSDNSSEKGGEKESSSGSSTQSNSQSYVTPEEDAAYKSVTDRIVAATKSGKQPDAKDLEEASRMVRMAAAKAMPNTKVVDKDGLPLVVYHRTPKYFNAFDKQFIGSSNNMNTFFDGFYFGDVPSSEKNERKDENGEGWHNMACFVNLTKPFYGDVLNTPFDTVGVQEIADVIYKDNGMHPDHYEWLVRNEEIDKEEGDEGKWRWIEDHYPDGIDGVIINNTCYSKHNTEVIATEPNQIKSADPVTYDDDGNVVPLSKRFDSGNDIRGAV